MPLQTIIIEKTSITFDREKTRQHCTSHIKPCNCQNCRNFRKNLEQNPELLRFLADFGVDFMRPDEVFSYDLEQEKDSLISSEGYYGVVGNLSGEDVSLAQFGVTIRFVKAANVPHHRTAPYFWIVVEGAFPYILEEERDIPPVSRWNRMKGWFGR